MANALDAVLQYRAQQQAQDQANAAQITNAFKMFTDARQQAVENNMKSQLLNAQVKNYESEALKNTQATSLQEKQNALLEKSSKKVE